jgi:CAI-1 autoinducer synthase
MSAVAESIALRPRRPVALSGLDAVNRRIAEWEGEFVVANRLVLGAKPGPDAVVLSSNDYLALARDPRIVEAMTRALRNSPTDVLMSTVYTQYLEAQMEFEAAMAGYVGAAATVLCQSGWTANDALMQVLADSETPVYLDLMAHASLWQGTHNAGARPRPFRHNDPESLEALIRRYGPGLIAVDSVYSLNGDLCPLAALVDAAERHDCALVVDESHAIGVRGGQGAGLVAELGFAERVAFRTFSLSKAFVGRGGMVAGPERALLHFRYDSRPAVFSSAVLLHEVAGFVAALEAVRSDEWRRQALKRKANDLKAGLRAAGWAVSDNDSPIAALIPGSDELTLRLRDALEARNVFGAVFCTPATAKNRSLLRLTLNAAVTQAELDHVISACAAVRRELALP